jgi:type II protein arginine methyltransferase
LPNPPDLRELARTNLHRLARQGQGDPRKLAAVASLAAALGSSETAFALAAEARRLAPGDADIIRKTRRAFAAGVPAWHFSIVKDEARNDAWDRALRKAVRPGDTVLDIGSGSSLLAMMAARAGAARVISCEMNPAVADAAAEIVARNGLTERITIVPRHSTALDPERDMGGRADVLVSEIISNDMLGQDVLGIVGDARNRLLKPGAAIIPTAGDVRVALAEWRGLPKQRLRTVSGFDLAPFNRLAATPHRLRVGDPQLGLRSDPVTLFGFDFAGGAQSPLRAERRLPGKGGAINGVAQWIRIHLDDETVYENRPAADAMSCWLCLFYPLEEAVQLPAGAEVTVRGERTQRDLDVWLEL